MDELVLVRHAETEWSGRRYCGRTDLPLTTRGEVAAMRLGRELADSLPPAVRIVSSPLRRARQTAAAIAAATGSGAFVVDDRWAETDFGAAEGLTYDELEQAQPLVAARLVRGDATIDWPGGESALALRTRVEAAWRDVIRRPGSVVVVSHGGPLRIVIALTLDATPGDVSVPDPGTVWRRRRSPVLRFPA
jgi:broad specificity phosphatase PhoE